MTQPYSDLWPGGGPAWSRRAAVDQIDRLSRLLDIAFAIPFTRIRFGVEAVVRMIPGIGDVAASALSCWVLYAAWRLGIPRPLLMRMMANVLVEGIAGTIPVVGHHSTSYGAPTDGTSVCCASISSEMGCFDFRNLDSSGLSRHERR